jgi:hypothetical protein
VTMTPERENLAAAIERLSGVNAQLNQARAAFNAVPFPEIEECEAALSKAQQGETQRALDLALKREPETPSVEAAQAALDTVQREWAVATRTREILREEIHRLTRSDLDSATSAVEIAVSAVITADGGVAEIIAEYNEVNRRAATLRSVVNLLPGNARLPIEWGDGPVDDVEVVAWKNALRQLRTDPSAPLPTDPPPPAERKAA